MVDLDFVNDQYWDGSAESFDANAFIGKHPFYPPGDMFSVVPGRGLYRDGVETNDWDIVSFIGPLLAAMLSNNTHVAFVFEYEIESLTAGGQGYYQFDYQSLADPVLYGGYGLFSSGGQATFIDSGDSGGWLHTVIGPLLTVGHHKIAYMRSADGNFYGSANGLPTESVAGTIPAIAANDAEVYAGFGTNIYFYFKRITVFPEMIPAALATWSAP